jgi:hypothetical protein
LEEGWRKVGSDKGTTVTPIPNLTAVRKRLARSNLTQENMVEGQINLEVGQNFVDGLCWLEGIPMGGLSDAAAEIPTLLKGGPTSMHVASHIDILMHPEGKTRKTHEEAEEC